MKIDMMDKVMSSVEPNNENYVEPNDSAHSKSLIKHDDKIDCTEHRT